MPSLFPTIAAISEPDLDVDAGGEGLHSLQLVDGLRGGLVDVDQPLVRADLEVLARVLVLERAADDAVDVLVGGKRDRARDRGARALGGAHDLLGSPVYGVVVVRLEPDPDLSRCQ